MKEALTTHAWFEWHDADRHLVFAWNGDFDTTVTIVGNDGHGTDFAEFPLPASVQRVMRFSQMTVVQVLELFQLACAAWRPASHLERVTMTGYDPAVEDQLYSDLRAAVITANRAGDDVQPDHLNAVWLAAHELTEIRG
jgi:hypothetical protein